MRRIYHPPAQLAQESEVHASADVHIDTLPSDVAAVAAQAEQSSTSAELDVNIPQIDDTLSLENLSPRNFFMRRKYHLASEELAADGTATPDPAHPSPDDDGSDLPQLAIEKLPGAADDQYGHNRATMDGAEVKEHGKGPDHSYGSDRASMHGAEVHEIEAEHVTLEQALLGLEQQCLAIEEAADKAQTLQALAVEARHPLNRTAKRILAIATESLLADLGDPQASQLALELEADEDPALKHGLGKGEVQDIEPKSETHKPGKEGESKAAAANTPESKSLMEKIKAIWRSIYAAMKKAWLWVKDLFRRFMDMAPGLVKRAEQLKEQLKEIGKNHKHPGAEAISHPGHWEIHDALRVNRHLDDPENIPLEANQTLEVVAAQLNRFSKESLYNDGFLKLLKDGKPEQFSYDPHKEIAASKLMRARVPVKSNAEYPVFEMHSIGLLGGQWIVQRVSAEPLKGYQALEMAAETPALHSHEDEPARQPHESSWSSKHDTYNRMPLLTIEQALELVDTAEKMAKLVVEFRHGEGELSKCQLKLEQLAEDMVRLGGDNASSAERNSDVVEVQGWHKARQHFCAQAPRIFAKEPAQMVNYALRISSRLLKYAEIVGDAYVGTKTETDRHVIHHPGSKTGLARFL